MESALWHAGTGVRLASMFASRAELLPTVVWLAAFLATGAWFGAIVLRPGPRTAESFHQTVCAGTVLFLLLGRHHDVAGAGQLSSHHGAAARGGGTTLMLTMVALGLAAYFIGHTLRQLYLLGTARQPVADVAGRRAGILGKISSPRTVGLARVAVGAALAVMLLGTA